jgi:hypothetical protein
MWYIPENYGTIKVLFYLRHLKYFQISGIISGRRVVCLHSCAGALTYTADNLKFAEGSLALKAWNTQGSGAITTIRQKELYQRLWYYVF